jgi:hypothetical protein
MWFTTTKSTKTQVCSNCRHFVDDPARLESELPGIHILSPGTGKSDAEQGICTFHEQLLASNMSCEHFWARERA